MKNTNVVAPVITKEDKMKQAVQYRLADKERTLGRRQGKQFSDFGDAREDVSIEDL
jgi:hypothetical protein